MLPQKNQEISGIEIFRSPPDAQHRFEPIEFRGAVWDLSHLESFAFKLDPDIGTQVDVVVMFSCHCFTHSFKRDCRLESEIPAAEVYNDGREVRVLCEERFRLSKLILRQMVAELPVSRIQIANEDSRNFLSWKVPPGADASGIYGVFFDVSRDTAHKNRMVVKIQSAYILDDGLTKRQKQAKNVRWTTLLKAAWMGRKIRP